MYLQHCSLFLCVSTTLCECAVGILNAAVGVLSLSSAMWDVVYFFNTAVLVVS